MSPSLSRRRYFLFRLAAILLGLSPLLMAEVVLRVAGLGKPTDGNDPFVGFSEIHPLFVLNEKSQRYEIAKSRLTHFRPASFAAQKGKDDFRIFVLGGSTVQGRPWSTETSFPTWLELNLNAAGDKRHCQVINCGGVSYASYRLIPILREVLNYQPDLVIFCEGNNEFLEDRSYAEFKRQPPAIAWAERQVMQLRTYNLLRAGALSWPSDQQPREMLGPEVDARLDWQNGLAEYQRDLKWQADVISHFDFNLRRLVAIAREASVPLLFVMPVANLEWEPFKSEHRSDLTSAELARFDQLVQEARDLYASDLPAAVAKLQAAIQIDDQYAAAHYELGMTLLELDRRNEAEQALRQAKELDVCPLRILAPMQAIMQQVAAETATPAIDAEQVIVAESRNGFPDRQWLVDHCHPTIEGNQLIATAIAEKMVELRYVQADTGWQTARETAFRAHLASLSPVYFERARQRLTSEQGWARGQVKRQRPNSKHPATKHE